MTGPNAELAYRVLDHIDADPETWNQEWWFTVTECGTAACFAGWACTLSGDRPDIGKRGLYFSTVFTAHGLYADVAARACDLLGITAEDADDLFDPRNTREDLDRLVEKFFGPRPAGEPS